MTQLERRTQKLVEVLNNKVDKIAIFGSALSKDFKEISDIDIMLFINPVNFEYTKDLISNSDIGSKFTEQYICSYTKLEDIEDDDSNKDEKPFHITFLPENDYSDFYLWQKNSDNLKFIN